MIVIIGSQHDKMSQKLVEMWSSSGAVLCTCEDLSLQGWRHYNTSQEKSTAIVSGQVVPYNKIKGVLTRRPFVLEQELFHISAEDRTYVAAEMTAFLISWLSSLSCRILNRPTAMCLSGPNWRREQWIHAAHIIGINIEPIKRNKFSSTKDGSYIHEDTTKVTVVGNQCIGNVDEIIANQARRLAKISGTDLLEVEFSGSGNGSIFLNANTWPDLNDACIADEVLHYLENGPTTRWEVEN